MSQAVHTSKYNTVIWRICIARTDRLSSATRTVVIHIHNECNVIHMLNSFIYVYGSELIVMYFTVFHSKIQWTLIKVLLHIIDFLPQHTQIWDIIILNCITYIQWSESNKSFCKYYYYNYMYCSCNFVQNCTHTSEFFCPLTILENNANGRHFFFDTDILMHILKSYKTLLSFENKYPTQLDQWWHYKKIYFLNLMQILQKKKKHQNREC